MIKKIINRWESPGGYKQILVVSIPLILSTGSLSVKFFVDRMFLAWLNPIAIAAAMPAGALAFVTMSFFMGITSYVNTFVAQYYGAKAYKRIGAVIWQGGLIALIAGIFHILLIPFSSFIFNLIGHSKAIQTQEIIYYNIMCLGATVPIAAAAMSGFFTGRGKNWIILWVNIFSALVNILLDYILIFGNWGFPKMGIKGAAIATVISSFSAILIYLTVMFSPSNNKLYGIFEGISFDKKLFMRLIKYGVPNGTQYSIEKIGFTAFILFLGRLGDMELVATSITFNINNLIFMPMIGMGTAISVLVGQNLGKNNPALATRSTYSGFHMASMYMGSMAIVYFIFPDIFLKLFAYKYDAESFIPIRTLSVNLLKFVALYSLSGSFIVVFSSAIKGAGDTKFVMRFITIGAICLLVIPSYIVFFVFKLGIYGGWSVLTFYVMLTGIVFFIRFRGGKWKYMRVIEKKYTNTKTNY